MKNRNPNDLISPGVKLEYTLNGHKDIVYSIAWSPDGQTLASGSEDWTIRLWNPQTGQSVHVLSGHTAPVFSVAWSPDGQTLASGSEDRTIRLWNPQTGQLLRTLGEHAGSVLSIAWSPDGQILASGSEEQTIRLWDTKTGKLLLAFAGYPTTTGYPDATFGIVWSADGQTLASVPVGNTVSLWDPKTGLKTRILEGHTGRVMCISESFDGHLLASKSSDGEVRIWRNDPWETVAILDEAVTDTTKVGSLAFHPHVPLLATSSDTAIHIWSIDTDILLTSTSPTGSVHYTNAKVILVGDTGVGKSGLSLALTGQPFAPTESTHGRHIWLFDQQEVLLDNEHAESRETLLWDLAGQPGYRLVHQLHLDDIAVALVVFNPHSETDPFAGVHYWTRALHTVQRIQGGTRPMKTLLVAARMDRGGASVSRERINTLIQDLQFDGYYETSAKEGLNIKELIQSIGESIDWNVLPRVTSTILFQRIKYFLITEKNAGRLLSTLDDLYRIFIRTEIVQDDSENLRVQFEGCIRAMETEGLIRRFSFGNLILLQPELLDAYTSALVNAVRDEPDGLGSISESKALKGSFFIPADNRVADEDQERLLLIAVVEDLLRYDIALREQGGDDAYLIFPSQATREFPDLLEPEGKTVIFTFEGPILNIYTALAVRLSHSGFFKKKEIWKNTVVYEATVGGTCGVLLSHTDEGQGEMTLFFDKRSSEETRFHFEEFVYTHLQRLAVLGSIKRRRIFICNECGTSMPDQIVQTRLKRGMDWLYCPVCETRLSLLDRVERLSAALTSMVIEMDRLADQARERETTQSTVSGKRAAKDFDVFLCYTHENKLEVKKIGERLKERGILPWLDEWELQPGLPWQRTLEEQMDRIKSIAVFVGTSGTSPWQDLAMRDILRQFVDMNGPVMPVILPGINLIPTLPPFLGGLGWVDFRRQDPDPLEQLIWGITGKKNI